MIDRPAHLTEISLGDIQRHITHDAPKIKQQHQQPGRTAKFSVLGKSNSVMINKW